MLEPGDGGEVLAKCQSLFGFPFECYRALAGILPCTRLICRNQESRKHDSIQILTNPAPFGFSKRPWFKWGHFFSQGYVCEILGYKAGVQCHTFYSFMHSPDAAPCVTLLSYPNCKIKRLPKHYRVCIRNYSASQSWFFRSCFSLSAEQTHFFFLVWNPLDGTREYCI